MPARKPKARYAVTDPAAKLIARRDELTRALLVMPDPWTIEDQETSLAVYRARSAITTAILVAGLAIRAELRSKGG